ncbi:MAG TPA: tetratricopeptide repeat protein [Pirellulales bacterium]|jgi:tetratricopeptide (TPR) repeat protein|nr:tetratricopeptide repeat protein [Pirellulales bacterium]
MNLHINRRPGGRAKASLAIAVVIGGGMLALWYWDRPGLRLERALAALDSHNWELLQYAQVSLPRTAEFAAPSSLFAGVLQLEQKEFRSALRSFRRAADDPAISPLAWVYSGEALYAQNRFREAEMNFKYALELDAGLIEAHRWLAIAYYDIGVVDGALRHLQRVAELDPGDARPHRVMAVIHMGHGSYATAVEDFEESLRRDPGQQDRQETLTELAEAQVMLRRYDDARRTLLGCEPTSEVLGIQAEVLYGLGDKARARQLAERALEGEPGEPWAVTLLGKLALDDSRFEEAVEKLSEGVKHAPNAYELRYALVTALRAARREEDAEKELQVVEDLRKMGDQFEALVEEASANPYDADIRYRLGVLADRIKTPEIAETWFKAAVCIDAKHALALGELRKRRSASFNASAFLRGQ